MNDMVQVGPKNTKVSLRDYKIRPQVFIPLVILHIGVVFAPLYMSPGCILYAVILWIVTGMLGVTVGYHRLLTHRGFKTYKLIKYFHVACASISLQQGPISWVRIHRAHHSHSDTDRDPHTQRRGFLYGHLGWPFLKHREIGRSPEVKVMPQDLTSDKVIVFFEKYHYHIFIFSLIAIYLWGGISYLLWLGCVRTVWLLHTTWAVNSLGHRFGYRNFDTKDLSTNNWFVAIITFGEGWHNNHHRYPQSTRHGIKWYEFDLTWLYIRMLFKLGLVWDLKVKNQVVR